MKAQRLQAEKEEEEEYRRQLMAKFAEDDRIEQMTAQKRRMKQLGKQSHSIHKSSNQCNISSRDIQSGVGEGMM